MFTVSKCCLHAFHFCLGRRLIKVQVLGVERTIASLCLGLIRLQG